MATHGKYNARWRRERDTTTSLLAGNDEGDSSSSSSSSDAPDGREGDKGEAYVAVQGLLTLLLVIAPCKTDPQSMSRVGGLCIVLAQTPDHEP